MKATKTRRGWRPGVTLIELSVVIFVILSLMGATMYFAGNLGEWNKGKKASAALQEVYAAQRLFLSDHPRRTVSSLTAAEIIAYLPSGAGALPVVEGLEGASVTIDFTVSPPVLTTAGGSAYDPSGDSGDSLWDVGE